LLFGVAGVDHRERVEHYRGQEKERGYYEDDFSKRCSVLLNQGGRRYCNVKDNHDKVEDKG